MVLDFHFIAWCTSFRQRSVVFIIASISPLCRKTVPLESGDHAYAFPARFQHSYCSNLFHLLSCIRSMGLLKRLDSPPLIRVAVLRPRPQAYPRTVSRVPPT
jgi:hypothetical protein